MVRTGGDHDNDPVLDTVGTTLDSEDSGVSRIESVRICTGIGVELG
jgi:hypothetical protein